MPLSSEGTRRRLTDRQAATVQRLTVAAVAELRANSYDGLTVRNVARRAGVAAATAYTYFTSKDHLVTEVFWRRLEALELPAVDTSAPPAARVASVLHDVALLVADEPELAAACNVAMLGVDPDVKVLRDRIGLELRRRLQHAIGDRAETAMLRALELTVTGALVQAGMGHLTYRDLPDRLAEVAGLLFGGEQP